MSSTSGRARLTAFVVMIAFAGCKKKDGTAASPDSASSSSSTTQVINHGPPVDGAATLKVTSTATAGSMIEASWTGPGNEGDYIDLVPRGYTATSGEATYAYARDAIPVAKLRAPTAPGDYDVRYIVQLASERRVKATAPVTVSVATATLTLPPNAEADRKSVV